MINNPRYIFLWFPLGVGIILLFIDKLFFKAKFRHKIALLFKHIFNFISRKFPYCIVNKNKYKPNYYLSTEYPIRFGHNNFGDIRRFEIQNIETGGRLNTYPGDFKSETHLIDYLQNKGMKLCKVIHQNEVKWTISGRIIKGRNNMYSIYLSEKVIKNITE